MEYKKNTLKVQAIGDLLDFFLCYQKGLTDQQKLCEKIIETAKIITNDEEGMQRLTEEFYNHDCKLSPDDGCQFCQEYFETQKKYNDLSFAESGSKENEPLKIEASELDPQKFLEFLKRVQNLQASAFWMGFKFAKKQKLSNKSKSAQKK